MSKKSKTQNKRKFDVTLLIKYYLRKIKDINSSPIKSKPELNLTKSAVPSFKLFDLINHFCLLLFQLQNQENLKEHRHQCNEEKDDVN